MITSRRSTQDGASLVKMPAVVNAKCVSVMKGVEFRGSVVLGIGEENLVGADYNNNNADALFAMIWRLRRVAVAGVHGEPVKMLFEPQYTYHAVMGHQRLYFQQLSGGDWSPGVPDGSFYKRDMFVLGRRQFRRRW